MTILSNKKQGQGSQTGNTGPPTAPTNVVVSSGVVNSSQIEQQSVASVTQSNVTTSSHSHQSSQSNKQRVIVLVNEAQEANLTQSPMSPSNKVSQVNLPTNLSAIGSASSSNSSSPENLLILNQNSDNNENIKLLATKEDLINIEINEKLGGSLLGSSVMAASNTLASTSGFNLSTQKKTLKKCKNNKRKIKTNHNSPMRLQPPQQRQRSNLVAAKTTKANNSLTQANDSDDEDLLVNSDSDLDTSCAKESSDEDHDDAHELPYQQMHFNRRFLQQQQENDVLYGNIFTNNNSRVQNKGNKKSNKNNNNSENLLRLKSNCSAKQENDYLNNNSEDEYESGAVNVRRCLGSLMNNVNTNGKENLIANFDTLEEVNKK